MELNLAGKWAVITGASQGIGRAVARDLAAEGCNVHLAARTAADLDKTAQEIRDRYNVQAITHPVDLTQREDVHRLGEACADVDFLVNNAGSIPRGNLTEVDEETWDQSWALKVFGYINLTREIYPRMCERGSGVIVNVIGVGGERPDVNYIAGSTGNAALMMFSRCLGGDSIRYGVRVVAVNPGPVETEKYISAVKPLAAERLGDAERWRELSKRFPMQRAATSEEVSGLVAFLCSDRSSYISGSIMTIDGGIMSDSSMGVKRRENA